MAHDLFFLSFWSKHRFEKLEQGSGRVMVWACAAAHL